MPFSPVHVDRIKVDSEEVLVVARPDEIKDLPTDRSSKNSPIAMSKFDCFMVAKSFSL